MSVDPRIAALCSRVRAYYADHPPAEDYPDPRTFPPATEAQLRATEDALGLTLPPFLRALYARVGNGGFDLGPGWILYGADGGCPNRDGEQSRTIGQLLSRSGWRLNPRVEEALLRHPGRVVVSDSRPDGFLQIGDWGCGISIELDCTSKTARVYLVGYWGELPAEANQAGTSLFDIQLVAPSLEDWFERWLDGKDVDVLQGTLSRKQVDLVGITDAEEAAAVWKGLYWFDERWFTPPESPDADEDEDDGDRWEPVP